MKRHSQAAAISLCVAPVTPASVRAVTRIVVIKTCISPDGRRNRRRGFTLIEMLLATALCSVVLAALYGALHLHVNMKVNSRDRLETTRLNNDLADALTSDLQSLAAHEPGVGPAFPVEIGPPAPSLSLANTLPSFTSGLPSLQAADFMGSGIGERHLNIDGVTKIRPVRFFGDADSMVLLIDAPNARYPQYQRDGTAQESVRTRQVVWWLGTGNPLRVPVQRENDQTAFTILNSGSPDRGLLRAERIVPRMLMTHRQEVDRQSFQRAQCLSADAGSMRLRYFDGQSWISRWNSIDAGQLPVAVDVRIEFRNRPPISITVHLPVAPAVRGGMS